VEAARVLTIIIRFLIDENVDDLVGRYLSERGHEVLYARTSLGSMSPDQLIAFTAETRGLVVVTHDKDFRRFSQLLPVGFQRRFARVAGRISLNVKEPRAVQRIREEIEAIEFHYAQAV
jgi:predicted nuclease of predicted toxin-antitoxin system